MNPEDILRDLMNGRGMSPMQQVEPVDEELLDTFINRVRDEKDMNLYMIAQAISYRFSPNWQGIMSFEEARILPQVVERIKTRLKNGEQ